MREEDTPICTRSTSLPNPTYSMRLATEFLVDVVEKDCGVKNGKTALYWHLIAVIQSHAETECVKERKEQMRAIIIEDKDAKSLLDQLKLEQFEGYCSRTCAIEGISESARKAMVEEIHRRFHYVVTSWLQKEGATTG